MATALRALSRATSSKRRRGRSAAERVGVIGGADGMGLVLAELISTRTRRKNGFRDGKRLSVVRLV